MFGRKKSKETSGKNEGMRIDDSKMSKSVQRARRIQEAKASRDYLKQKFDL